MRLAWNAAARATTYRVTVNGTVEQTLSGTSWTKTGLPRDGAKYTWSVTAVGDSGLTNTSETRTFFSGYPPKPELLAPAAQSLEVDRSVRLSWSKSKNATRYKLWYYTRLGPQEPIVGTDAYFDIPAEHSPFDGTEIKWKVAAGHEAGFGEYAEEQLFFHGLPAPPRSGSPRDGEVFGASARFEWAASESPAAKAYLLEIWDDELTGSYSLSEEILEGRSFTVTDLPADGRTMRWRVSAGMPRDPSQPVAGQLIEWGEPSETWSFESLPASPPNAPVPITPVGSVVEAGESVELEWEEDWEGPVADMFEVEVFEHVEGSVRPVILDGDEQFTEDLYVLVDGFANDGRRCEWRVRGRNILGPGPWSPMQAFWNGEVQPPAPPELKAPVRTVTTAFGANLLVPNARYIPYSWFPSEEATVYEFVLATDANLSNRIGERSGSPVARTAATLYQSIWKEGSLLNVWDVRNYPNNGATFHWGVRAGRPNVQTEAPDDYVWSAFAVASFQNGVPDSIGLPGEDLTGAPAVPRPAYPLNGARVPTRDLTLRWHAAEHASAYIVEVSTSPDFGAVWDRLEVSDTQFTLTDPLPQDNTTLYWRVQALNDDRDTSAFSEVWSFVSVPAGTPSTEDDPAAPLSPPLLNAPGPDEVVSGEEITFSWHESIGANRYRIQVARDAAFSQVTHDSVVTSLDAAVPGFLNLGTPYYWRVCAGRADAAAPMTWGGYSPARVFFNGLRRWIELQSTQSYRQDTKTIFLSADVQLFTEDEGESASVPVSDGSVSWALTNAAGGAIASGALEYRAASGIWAGQKTLPESLPEETYSVAYTVQTGSLPPFNVSRPVFVGATLSVTGRVVEGDRIGAGIYTPVSGATVTVGGQSTVTDGEGNYSLSNIGARSTPRVRVEQTGFALYDAPLDPPEGATALVHDIVLYRSTGGVTVTDVRMKYSGTFLAFMPLANPVTVSVDWAGKTPGKIKLYANRKLMTEQEAASQGETKLTLRMERIPMLAGGPSQLEVIAESADGAQSEPRVVPLSIIEVPPSVFYVLNGAQTIANDVVYTGKRKLIDKKGYLENVPLLGRFGPDLQASLGGLYKLSNGEWEIFLNGRPTPKNEANWHRNPVRISDNMFLFLSPNLKAEIEATLKMSGVASLSSGFGLNPEASLGLKTSFRGRLLAFYLTDAIPAGQLVRTLDTLSQFGIDINSLQRLELQGALSLGATGVVRWENASVYPKELTVQPGLGFDLVYNPRITDAVTLKATLGGKYDPNWRLLPDAQWLGHKGSAVLVLEFDAFGLTHKASYLLANWDPSGKTLKGNATLPEWLTIPLADNGQWETAPRDYLAARQASAPSKASSDLAQFRALGQAAQPKDATGPSPAQAQLTLARQVYPEARPSLAARGNELLLVYPEDNGSGTDIQRTDINWLHYDGANWSVSAPVEQDTRAEFSPSVRFDGQGNAVAIWERVKDPAFELNDPAQPSGEDLRGMLEDLEIVWSRWDRATKTWSAPVALTDNAHLDHAPLLAGPLTDGSLLAAWTENTANQIVGTGAQGDTRNSRVYWSRWNPETQSWSSPEVLIQAVPYRTSHTLAAGGGKAVCAWTQDMDSDLGTPQDQELFCRAFDATTGTWNVASPLTLDAAPVFDGNVEAVVSSTGVPYLVWQRDDALVMDKALAGAPEPVREDSGTAGVADFALSISPDNDLALVWSQPSDTGSDPLFRIYDGATGYWSEDLPLREDRSLEKGIATAWDASGNLTAAYACVDVTLGTTDAETEGGAVVKVDNVPQFGAADLCVTKRALTCDAVLAAGGLVATGSSYMPGDSIEIAATLKGAGERSAGPVDVAFYDGDPGDGGNLIGRASTETPLRAGGIATAKIVWTLPAPAKPRQIHAVADPDGTVAESDETNNVAALLIGLPDLEPQYVRSWVSGDGATRLTVEVHNAGFAESAPCAAVLQRSGAAASLGTVEVPALKPGQIVQLVLNLPANSVVGQEEVFIFHVDPLQTGADGNRANDQTSFRVSLLDQDGDGLSDGWETRYFGNISAQNAAGDPDHDGLSNRDEARLGTNPTKADTDGDGLADGAEANRHGTSPINADTDGDGLTDRAELEDHHLNPNSADTDGDALPDGWELAHGLDPASSNGAGGPAGDPDGDGISNREEFEQGLHPTSNDSDHDWLKDGEERLRYRTDPVRFDTDLDGWRDGLELALGTSPLNRESRSLTGERLGLLESERLAPGAEAQWPDVATDGKGRWMAAWVEVVEGTRTLVVARSRDAGRTWEDRQLVRGEAARNAPGEPTLSCNAQGRWILLWNATVSGQQEICWSYSDDDGKTWSDGAVFPAMPTHEDVYSPSSPTLATDGKGIWIACWSVYNAAAPGSDSYHGAIDWSRSTDDGKTWQARGRLTLRPVGNYLHLRPHLATDRKGTWIVVFESNDPYAHGTDPSGPGSVGDDYDIFCVASGSNGEVWSNPVPIGSYFDSDYSDGAARIATDGQGRWVVVWESDNGHSENGDVEISAAVSTSDGRVWSEEVTVNDYAGQRAGWDAAPQVTVDARGQWQAVWQSDVDTGGTDSNIWGARSTDGISWSAAIPLNTPATDADDDSDFAPSVATDGLGHYLLAWSVNQPTAENPYAQTILFAYTCDSDGDGLDDFFEMDSFGHLDESANGDPDFDGLRNEQEDRLGTNPARQDTDGDGIPDWDELESRGTDPTKPDTDGDGLLDNQDPDPLNPHGDSGGEADPDGDGLSNLEEQRHGTSMTNPDSDSDGISDSQEIEWGFNPIGVDADEAPEADPDGDGLDNGREIALGTHPRKPDTDGDGFVDGEEMDILATNPRRMDTDGDGASDGEENGRATNPADAESVPDTLALLDYTDPPSLLEDEPKAGRTNPHIVTDGRGHWVMAWTRLDEATGKSRQWTAHSYDSGRSWHDFQAVPGLAAESPLPNVALATDREGRWVLLWGSTVKLAGVQSAQTIYWSYSDDDGHTWSEAAVFPGLDTSNTAFEYAYPALATDENGVWVACWSDRGTVLRSRSRDNAVTWSAPLIFVTAQTVGRENRRPRVATDKLHRWMVVWESNDTRDNTGDDWDLFYIRSTQDAVHWSAPAVLSATAPVDRPEHHDTEASVAADGRGRWLVVWKSTDALANTIGTDADIVYELSTDHGETWNGGPNAINHYAASDAGSDALPQVAVDALGQWQVVWQTDANFSGSGTDWDLVGARSFDGEHWSKATLLNSHAVSDNSAASNGDGFPGLATDGLGHWVVAWSSNGPHGLEPYNDSNIFVACGISEDADRNRLGTVWERTVLRTPSDASHDVDGDSLANPGEFNALSDPYNQDSDADGLPDAWEAGHGLSPGATSGPNGADADPDGDGLSNAMERRHGSHPRKRDTDDDGLDDRTEVNRHRTNPAAVDTDGDGINDDWELRYNLDPLQATAENGADWDNDGLTTLQEFTHRSDPNNPDTDGDLLNDGPEVESHFTDPTRADTDNDGAFDGHEHAQHSDPQDSASVPSFPLRIDEPVYVFPDDVAVADGQDTGWPQVAFAGNGRWLYSSSRYPVKTPSAPNPPEPLWMASSGDDGATWGAIKNVVPDERLCDLVVRDVLWDGQTRLIALGGDSEPARSVLSSRGNEVDDWYILSDDLGETWTAPLEWSPRDLGVNGQLGTLVADEAGRWAAFGEGKATYSRDNGTTWTTVRTPYAANAWQEQIATDGHGTWVMAMTSKEILSATAGTDDDIVVVRSKNQGRQWDQPTLLHPMFEHDTTQESVVFLRAGGQGRFTMILRRSGMPSGTVYYASTSSDGGVTWSEPVVLPAFGLAFDMDKQGNAITIGDGISCSTDGGLHWSPTIPLPAEWKTATRLDLAAGDDGTWLLALRSYDFGDYDQRSVRLVFPDSDGDGVSDFQEREQYRSHPLRGDSDDDGLPDGWEIAHVLDPANATGSHGAEGDPEGDGVSNDDEQRYGSNPHLADSDGDGLTDHEEIHVYRTDPVRLHSDYDGFDDLYEVAAGVDPADRADRPTLESGSDFLEHALLAQDVAGTGDRDPVVTTDGRGHWVMAWHRLYERLNKSWLWVAHSYDAGRTWQDHRIIPGQDHQIEAALGSENIALTTDGRGRWVLVWSADPDSNQRLYWSASNDDGRTWSAAARFPGMGDLTGSEYNHHMQPSLSTDGAGTWVACWSVRLRQIGGSSFWGPLYWSRSTDNGLTWAAPSELVGVPNATRENLRPHVLTDRQGRWIIVWESNDTRGGSGDDWDIFHIRSTDNGATWGPATPLTALATSDSALDHDRYPSMATDGSGRWVVVWQSSNTLGGTLGSEDDIFYTESHDHGTNWSSPAPLDSNAGRDNGSDQYPHVLGDALGQWRVVWQSDSNLDESGTDWDIRGVQSTGVDGNRLVWTPTRLLNRHAVSDNAAVTNGDGLPRLAADGYGHWVLAWMSGGPHGSEPYGDLNILIAPNLADVDSDGVDDYRELAEFGDLDGGIGTNPLGDADADGMPNGWELAHGFNPTRADADGDADNDGYTNYEEYASGSHPHQVDDLPKTLKLLRVASSTALVTGGSPLVLEGVLFTPGCRVLIDEVEAVDVTVDANGKRLTAVLPPGVNGHADVRVEDPEAGTADGKPDVLQYTAYPFLEGLDMTPGEVRSWRDDQFAVQYVYLPETGHVELTTPQGIRITLPATLRGSGDAAIVIVRSAAQPSQLHAGAAVGLPARKTLCTSAVDISGLILFNGELRAMSEPFAEPATITFPLIRKVAPEDIVLAGAGTHLDQNLNPYFELSPGESPKLEPEEAEVAISPTGNSATFEFFGFKTYAGIAPATRADTSGDGVVTAVDIQQVINASLGLLRGPVYDINMDSKPDAADVQLVILAALRRPILY